MSMQALRQDTADAETVWFGLGPDVEGRCDGCLKGPRRLIAQHAPSDRWFCLHCFRAEMIAREKDL